MQMDPFPRPIDLWHLVTSNLTPEALLGMRPWFLGNPICTWHAPAPPARTLRTSPYTVLELLPVSDSYIDAGYLHGIGEQPLRQGCSQPHVQHCSLRLAPCVILNFPSGPQSTIK